MPGPAERPQAAAGLAAGQLRNSRQKKAGGAKERRRDGFAFVWRGLGERPGGAALDLCRWGASYRFACVQGCGWSRPEVMRRGLSPAKIFEVTTAGETGGR